jgi:hypothetical protein
MADLALAGIGVWSERFSNWEQFCATVRGEPVAIEPKLQPELIPARERRRAPLCVKMAIEVMDQACRMADADRSSVATVFGSGMGDMQITDYMCRTLASDPRALSPTRFHNSVHNACTGYWSIATESKSPASAVSAYEHSAAMALLEGAIQAVVENIPVVVAFQEVAPTEPFKSVYAGSHPLAMAFLLRPKQGSAASFGTLTLDLLHARQRSAMAPGLGDSGFAGNFASSMLGLATAIAEDGDYAERIPVSESSWLSVAFSPLRRAKEGAQYE